MTFTNKTIYRDLMRKVHPDLNPTMVDATRKSQMVNAVKNDLSALTRLARAWGFIKGNVQEQTTQHTHTYTRPAYTRPHWMDVINPHNLNDLGLMANRLYGYINVVVEVVVRINKRESTHRVLRTTKKCVVVDFNGVKKTVRMSNIIRRIS
jgi:hypothetical protein